MSMMQLEDIRHIRIWAEMQNFPEVFQLLFVLHDDVPLKRSYVIHILKFPTMNDEETTI